MILYSPSSILSHRAGNVFVSIDPPERLNCTIAPSGLPSTETPPHAFGVGDGESAAVERLWPGFATRRCASFFCCMTTAAGTAIAATATDAATTFAAVVGSVSAATVRMLRQRKRTSDAIAPASRRRLR